MQHLPLLRVASELGVVVEVGGAVAERGRFYVTHVRRIGDEVASLTLLDPLRGRTLTLTLLREPPYDFAVATIGDYRVACLAGASFGLIERRNHELRGVSITHLAARTRNGLMRRWCLHEFHLHELQRRRVQQFVCSAVM
jgi:hypothetical protein